MYDDNNDIKKRQVEVLKEGLELQNDVNEFAKEINKGIPGSARDVFYEVTYERICCFGGKL